MDRAFPTPACEVMCTGLSASSLDRPQACAPGAQVWAWDETTGASLSCGELMDEHITAWPKEAGCK